MRLETVLAAMRSQTELVDSFVATGRLRIQTPDGDTDALTLVAGAKKPWRLKVEATHPWGRPLFHILIYDTRLEILSYVERRHYRVPLGGLSPSRFLPVRLEREEIWSLLRGYPVVPAETRARMDGDQHIVFVDAAGKTVQRLGFDTESMLQREVFFPPQGIRLSYDSWERRGGFWYARRMIYDDQRQGASLSLRLRDIRFNTKLPAGLFAIRVPAGFTRGEP